MEEHEEFEQVPWADLMADAEPEDRRRRAIYLAAGLLGSMVLGVMVARTWWASSAVVEPVAPATTAVDVAASVPDTTPSVPTLPLYSEADLMADPPDPGAQAAITRAEWFVSDYFTADLEPSGSADIRAALPAEATEGVDFDIGDAVTYVEWARAFRVEEAGDGAYRVSVAFRSLGAPPDRGFTRQPVRAVSVLVAVAENGGTSVVDLPTPIPLPIGPAQPAWDGVEMPPPQEVVDLVAARASLWGSQPQIISASELDGEWRVLVTVADAIGARWPFALRVSGG